MAVLAAGDAAPGRLAVPGQVGSGDVAQFGIARYQRDILQNSTIGGFLTTRRFAGDYNTVAAVDGQIRLPLQTIGYQMATSFTERSVGLEPGVRGRTSRGDATYVWYDLAGRHWRLFINDLRISGDYRAAAAFVSRTGIQATAVNLGYELQGDDTWWVRVRPFVVARAARTPDRLLDESYVDPGADVTLARDISIYTYHSLRRDAFLGREYDTRSHVTSYTVNTFARVGMSGRLRLGEAVSFNPAAPQVGRHVESSLTVTLKPNARLTASFCTSRAVSPSSKPVGSSSIRRCSATARTISSHGSTPRDRSSSTTRCPGGSASASSTYSFRDPTRRSTWDTGTSC